MDRMISKSDSAVVRLGTALAPNLLTPVLVQQIAFGNLGSSEKDLVFAFAWGVWSVIFT